MCPLRYIERITGLKLRKTISLEPVILQLQLESAVVGRREPLPSPLHREDYRSEAPEDDFIRTSSSAVTTRVCSSRTRTIGDIYPSLA